MKRASVSFSLLLLLYSVSSFALEKTVSFGRFGTVALYSAAEHPSQVVLFVSGDAGWKLGVVDMARELAAKDALVAGIDIRHYLKELEGSKPACSYPAGDFEDLSKYIQKMMAFPAYVRPILIGYSSGATLVYATLAQAPSATFAGAVSMGFCPDLELTKPLCKGYGLEYEPGPKGKGYNFLPAKNLEAPWIALQGAVDSVCGASTTSEYLKHVPRGELVLLPKVGHGYSAPRNWMPQFRAAFDRIVGEHQQTSAKEKPALAPDINNLPVVEVLPKDNTSGSLAVIVTGDGGWASIDKSIGGSLAHSGMPVVGFDSLQYFWSRRDAKTASADLQRIVQHYLAAWKKDTAILIGYSFGADVLPAMAAGFPPELRSKIKLITLLGPGHTADFEFHLTDWLGGVAHTTEEPILPEIERLKGTKFLCMYGDDDNDTVCKDLKAEQAVVVSVQGGHHFGGDYQSLADRILKESQ